MATGKLFYADYYEMELEVLASAKIDDTVVIDYPMTVNLNGKTIKAVAGVDPMFRIESDVTFTGAGKVDARNGEAYAFILGKTDGTKGNLTINGDATYYGEVSVASVTKGNLTINGGKFAVNPYKEDGQEDNYNFLLNCIDANYKDGTAKIEVKGGTFYKFNPADNAAEGANTNFCAEGYLSEANGDYFGVRQSNDVKEAVVTISFTNTNTNETVTLKYPSERFDSIQKLIGTNDYADFVYGAEQSELLAYVANGTATDIVMTLHDDVVLDETLMFYDKYYQVNAQYSITLDLNRHTLSAAAGMENQPVIRVLSDLTVKNGTVDGTPGTSTYAFIVGQAGNPGSLTIEDGTYMGDTSAVSITEGTANITGGTFSATAYEGAYEYLLNCIDANYKDGSAKFNVTGGTFVGFNPENNKAEGENTNFVSKGYKATEANGSWTVEPNMIFEFHMADANGEAHWLSPMQSNDLSSGLKSAKIWYDSLQGTYSFTLKILEDCELDEAAVIDFPMTIDLNDKTITGQDVYPVIRVQNGADVTVKNGTITNDDYVFVLGASDGSSAGNLTIKSGIYEGGVSVASVTKGTLTITGGDFSVAENANYGSKYLLNCIDANYKDGTAEIEVKGGTFHGFNPGDNLAETVHTDFVSEGYVAEELTEGKFTVRAQNFVAQIGETKYESITEALNACTNGETVQLIADVTYGADDVVYAHGGATGFGNYDQYNPSIVYVGGTKGATAAENQPSKVNAVLDLNGHTITSNADAYLFLIMDNAKVTFTDSVGTGKVFNNSESYPAIWSVGTDTLVTIKAGTYQTASPYGLIHATHSGDLVIEGGHFSTTADDASLLLMINSQKYNNPNYFLVGVATLTVKGGTFVGFNPEKVGDDYGATSIEDIKFFNGCAEGYAPEDDGNGNYTVKPEVVVTFADMTMVAGNELPEFTWTSNFEEVSEDGEMLVVETPNVTVNGAGEYEITANAYVFMSDKYVVNVVPGTLTVTQAVVMVDDIGYSSWTDAKAAIKGNSTIVLLTDITNDGSFSVGAANQTVTLDLNGHTFTTDTIGMDGHKTLRITDREEDGKVVVNNFTALYANGYLDVDSDVDFTSNIQLGYHSDATPSTGCFMVDGTKWIGRGHFSLDDGIVGTTGGYVTIKNGVLNITFNSGSFVLNNSIETLKDQTITVDAGATLTIPAGVTLTLDPTTNLTVNGTVTGEGTVEVATAAQLAQVLKTEIKNVKLVGNDDAAVALAASGDVTLDLNGKKMPKANLTVNGTMTIVDSSMNGDYKAAGTLGTVAVGENASLTVNAGTYASDVTAYCGEDLFVLDNGNSTWTVVSAVAKVDDMMFETVQSAINAANAAYKEDGTARTVIMIADSTEDYITVKKGVTLDLNGKTLTAEYVIGLTGSVVVDNSTDKTGLVKVSDKDNMNLAKNNSQLPVWTEDGYVFTVVRLGLTVDKDIENGSAQANALPQFQTKLRSEINEAMAKGASNSGVSVVIRLTWTENTHEVSQDFVYNDAMVQTVVDSYVAGTGYKQMYIAKFSNLWLNEGIDPKVALVLVSDTNVEIVSDFISLV